jgi:hypothetical protein
VSNQSHVVDPKKCAVVYTLLLLAVVVKYSKLSRLFLWRRSAPAAREKKEPARLGHTCNNKNCPPPLTTFPVYRAARCRIFVDNLNGSHTIRSMYQPITLLNRYRTATQQSQQSQQCQQDVMLTDNDCQYCEGTVRVKQRTALYPNPHHNTDNVDNSVSGARMVRYRAVGVQSRARTVLSPTVRER